MFKLPQKLMEYSSMSWFRPFGIILYTGKNIERIIRHRLRKIKHAIYKLNIIQVSRLAPNKKTVLVVCHDATRTGAPVLSLNLVQHLTENYNVVVLLLGNGVLLESFKAAGVEVVIEPRGRWKERYAEYVIYGICKRHDILFALVNSIESRRVLPALASKCVPAISLLHEFASYTRPRNAFRDAILWSTETVFSTLLTLQNALDEHPDLNQLSLDVIPQGKCVVPSENIAIDEFETERLRLSRLIRPNGEFDDAIVVLGAGSVQLRKGVDIFIECASRVVRMQSAEKCRFVWVGSGYDPDDDVGYSVYLADQIRRAGLEKHIVFTGETTVIEEVYQLADLFLLSSRLDPLPNVAIDAMCFGLPVVCFDKTTGIADFLLQNGLGSDCVAYYHDTFELAQKVLALVESEPLRKKVGDKCRNAALATFNMERYVSRIVTKALAACDQLRLENADVQDIQNFCLSQNNTARQHAIQELTDVSAIREYVRRGKTGVLQRKPFPGFHPGIYSECHGLISNYSDPFADYLRSGQPQGCWNCKVISGGRDNNVSLPDGVKVALHLHIYYPELLLDIIHRLELNNIRPDLFVSVKDQSTLEFVVESLSSYSGKVVDVRIVPNRGRNIGPLFTTYGRELIKGYDLIGHLHTKQSFHQADRAIIEKWNNFLLENLLGGNAGGRMADNILSSMANDQEVGIVFPDDLHPIGWTDNLQYAEPIAERLGLSELPKHFNFPIGTMFWIRANVLKRFVELDFAWDDYPTEPLPYDGSMLHAIERLLGLVPTLDGMRYATTYIPGVKR